MSFALDVAAGGVGPLKPLDALLVLAINQANIAPLRRDAEARARYGHLDVAAPDCERRPVSINAVAASLGLPFETVRRRIRRLCAEGVCAETSAGVLVPAAFLMSGPYLISVVAAHERLRRFYFDLKAQGLAGAERPANYHEETVPVRAAAGLLADYVLRTSEALMRETGDAVSGMVLLMLLAAALDPGGAQPLVVRRLHERLRLPEETVRRRLLELAEDDDCLRTPRGYEVSEAMLAGPGLRALLIDNAANVQRLMAGLAERGLIESWERTAARPSGDPA